MTSLGRAALDDGHVLASGALRELFSPLTEAQRAVLLATLTLLTSGEPAEPAGA